MAGGPPDNYRKYMKQGDDGRWYWDDANNPDSITSDLKDDGKHPYLEAGAAVGYNMADAISGSKVERWKPPAEEKGKVEQVFGKPVTMTEQQWNQYYGGKAPAVSPTAATVATGKPVSQDEQLYNDMVGQGPSVANAPAGTLIQPPTPADTSVYVPATNGKIATDPKTGKSVTQWEGNTSTMGYEMKPTSAAMVTPEAAAKQDAQKTPGSVFMGKDGVRYVVGEDGSMKPVGKFSYGSTVPGPQQTFGPEPKAPAVMPSNAVSAQDLNDTSGKLWNTWTPPGTAAKGIYAGANPNAPTTHTGPKALNPLAGRYVATEDLRKAPDEFQSPSPVKRTWAATPDEQLYQDMMQAESIKAATPAPPWSAGPSPASGVYVDPATGKTIQLGPQVQYPPGAAMLPKNNPWYAEGGPKGSNAPIKAADTHPWGGAPAPELKVANYGDAESPWKPAPEAPAPGSMKVAAAPYSAPVPKMGPYKAPPGGGKLNTSKPIAAPEADPVLKDAIEGGVKNQAEDVKKGGKELDKLNAKNKGKKKIEGAKS